MEIKQENFQIKQVIRQTYQESQIDFNIYSNPNLKETCQKIQQLDQNSILLEIKNQIIDQNLFEETFDHQQINEVLEKIKQEKLFLQQSDQTDSFHTFLGLTILIIINRSKILRKYPQFPLIMINFYLQSLKEPESSLQKFVCQNLPEEILNLHQKNDQYFNFNTIVYQVNIYDIQYINSRLNFWNNSILQFKNFSLTKEFGQKTHFILEQYLKLGQFYEHTKTHYQIRDGTLLFQIDKQYISESVMQLSEFFALGSYTLTILLDEQNNQKDQNIIQIIKEIDGVKILKQTQNKIKFEFDLPENQCQINTSLILMDNLVEAIKNLSDLYNQQEQLEIVQLLSLVIKCTCGFALALSDQVEIFDTCNYCKQGFNQELYVFKCIQKGCSIKQCIDCVYKQIEICQSYDIINFPQICGSCDQNTTLQFNHRYWHCDKCKQGGSLQNLSHRACDFDRYNPHKPNLIREIKKQIECLNKIRKIDFKTQNYYYPQQFAQKLKKMIMTNFLHSLDLANQFNLEELLDFMLEMLDLNDYITADTINPIITLINQNYEFVYNLVITKLFNILQKKETKELIIKLIGSNQFYDIYDKIDPQYVEILCSLELDNRFRYFISEYNQLYQLINQNQLNLEVWDFKNTDEFEKAILRKYKSKHILIPGQNQDNNNNMVSEKISLIIQLINILHYIVYQNIETVRNNIDKNDINKIFKCVVSLKDGLKLQKKCLSFLCKNLIKKDNLTYEIITDIQNLLPKINDYAQNFSDIYKIMDQNNLLQPLQKIIPSSNLIFRINKTQGVQQLVIQEVEKFKEQISHYLCYYKNYPKEISKVFQTLSHEIEHYNLNQNFDQADMTYEQEESQYKHYLSKFQKYLTTNQQMNSQDEIQIPEKANKVMQFLLNLLFEQISQYKNNGYNSQNIQFNLFEPMVLVQILVRLFTIYPHLIQFSINFKNQNYDFDLLQIIFDGRYQEILNGQSLLQSIVENYPLYEIQYTKSLDHWIINSNDNFIFEKGINEFKTSLQNYVDKYIIKRNDHKEQDQEQTRQFKIIFYQINLLSNYDSFFLQILEIQLEYFHLLETKEQHDQYNLFLQNINSDQDLNIIQQVNKTKHQLNTTIFKKLEERDSDKIDLQPYFYYYNFTNFRHILYEKTIKIKEDQDNDPYNFITIKSDKLDDKLRNQQTSSSEQNVQMQKILDEIQSIDFTQQILGQDEAKQLKLNKFIVSNKKGQLKVINVKSVSADINANLQEQIFNSQNKFLNWIVNQKREKSISELFLNFTYLEDQIRFNKVQKTIEQIKQNTDISENVNLQKEEEDEEESKQYQEKEKDLKEEILKLQIQREFNESEQLKWQLYHQREKQIIQNMKNENGEIPFDQDWRKPSINLSLQEKKKYKQFIKKLNQEEREDLLKRMDEQVVKIIDQNLYKEALALKKGVFPEFGGKNNNKSKQKSRAPKDYDYFYDELIGEQTEEEEDEEAREVRYEIEEIIQEGCDSYEIEERISYYNELMGFNGEQGQEEDKNEDQKDLLFEDFEYNEKPDFYFNNAEITKQFQQLKEKSIETLLKCFINYNSTNLIINMESICSNIQNCYQIYDTIFYLLQLENQDIIQLSKSQDGIKILKSLGFYEIQEQLQKSEKNEAKINKIIQSLLETMKFKIICRTDLFNVGSNESNNYGYYMLFYSLISKESQTLLADCNFQEFDHNLKINSVPIIKNARNLTSKFQINSAKQQENKIYLLPIHLLSQVYENTTQISFKEKIKEKMRNIESQIVISKVKETEQKRKNSKEILQEIQNNWEEKTLQEILSQSALNLCPSSTPILFKKINYYKSFQSPHISSEKYVFNKGIEQEFQKQIFQAFPSLYQHYDFYEQSFTETWEYVLDYYEAFLKYAESNCDSFDGFQKLLSSLNKIIEKKENIQILSKQELDIFNTLNPQFQEKIVNSKDYAELKTKFSPLFDQNNSINLFKIQEQLEKHINQVLKLDDLKNQKKEEIKKSRMFKKYEKEQKYKDIDKQYENNQKITKVKVKQFLMELV
ncbi:hypothetical protein PPERSA_08262 [Pseudocohnilembus persalinus]|uniref:Uncharacterized protein n=1 Tax=Pseudocohnilembus persalinus TaxID=266149 RepID=A0A0V0QG16_PSEPJ|nr:hypothetical protein PPERSA_08262 [Pseudocohnilembus persalinus]|eukprot:KRX01161.1 hypothetical protein PPERSA_08262 [Pseudocohnilembus persalinus]